MSAIIAVYSGNLNVIVTPTNNETTWTYTLTNNEPAGSPNSINTIHLEVGTSFTVLETPPGWAYDTDNSTFILWYSTAREFDIPQGGSLSGFKIQGASQIALPTPITVTSWNQQTNDGGAVIIGALQVLTAAAVSVGGRVTGSSGRGVFRATVTMTRTSSGEKRSAMTNPFGYYRFNDVEVGETYVFEIKSKRNVVFAPLVVQIMGERFDLNFRESATAKAVR